MRIGLSVLAALVTATLTRAAAACAADPPLAGDVDIPQGSDLGCLTVEATNGDSVELEVRNGCDGPVRLRAGDDCPECSGDVTVESGDGITFAVHNAKESGEHTIICEGRTETSVITVHVRYSEDPGTCGEDGCTIRPGGAHDGSRVALAFAGLGLAGLWRARRRRGRPCA